MTRGPKPRRRRSDAWHLCLHLRVRAGIFQTRTLLREREKHEIPSPNKRSMHFQNSGFPSQHCSETINHAADKLPGQTNTCLSSYCQSLFSTIDCVGLLTDCRKKQTSLSSWHRNETDEMTGDGCTKQSSVKRGALISQRCHQVSIKSRRWGAADRKGRGRFMSPALALTCNKCQEPNMREIWSLVVVLVSTSAAAFCVSWKLFKDLSEQPVNAKLSPWV